MPSLPRLVPACAMLLAAAAAAAPHVAAAEPPTQIHVAYAGAKSEGLAVSWFTSNATASSTVQYGASASALTHTATGSALQYLQGYGYHHHVVLSAGLTPGADVYYKCGDAAAGFSAVLQTRTAPQDGRPFTVVVWGDMGVYNSNGTYALLHDTLAPKADWFWNLGDSSYADDAFLHDPLKFGYESTWNKWMNWMQPMVATKPMMVMAGNHEAECHSPICLFSKAKKAGLGNFSAYRARFRMPHAESGSGTNMWYSFDYNGVHVVSLDTETDFPNAPGDQYAGKNGGFGDQVAWLEADLAAAAAAGHTILVGGHRPMYSINSADADGSITGAPAHLAAAMEGLFHKYGVALYLAGHVHSYEASYPVFNATLASKSFNKPTATTHVVVGTGGNTEGHSSYAKAPRPAWHRIDNDQAYGAGLMTITPGAGGKRAGTTIAWTFIRASNATVADSFTITL